MRFALYVEKKRENRRLSRRVDVFWGTEEDSPGGGLETFPRFQLLALYYVQRREWARPKKRNKKMNAKKYKVAITETAAKTAAKKNGGAAARFFGVIVINKESGEKRTAADILTALAKKAAANKNEKAAAEIREHVKIYGGAFRRDTAAIVAAAAFAEINDECELAKSIAARLEEARKTEAEYTAEEERRKAERRARRLASMTDAQKAAAARREEIRAIKEDAKKRIDAIKAAA